MEHISGAVNYVNQTFSLFEAAEAGAARDAGAPDPRRRRRPSGGQPNEPDGGSRRPRWPRPATGPARRTRPAATTRRASSIPPIWGARRATPAIWTNLGVLLRGHRAARSGPDRAVAGPRARPFGSRAIRGNLANILADVGETEAALALRRELVAEQPDDFATIAMVGKSLRTLGRLRRGDRGCCRRPRHEAPDHAELRIQLALAQLTAGDYRRRLPHLRRALGDRRADSRATAAPALAGRAAGRQADPGAARAGFGDAVAFARFLPALRRFSPARGAAADRAAGGTAAVAGRGRGLVRRRRWPATNRTTSGST